MDLDSENESDLEISTPPDVLEQATSAATQILPEKSRSRYETLYKKFMDWRLEKNVTSYSENVLLAYF